MPTAKVFSFSVAGRPRAAPRARVIPGRRRPVSYPRGSAGRLWRDMVERAALRAILNTAWSPPPGCAFKLSMRFRFGTDDVGRHGTAHTAKPDADNLAKLIMDALTKAGAWPDDAAVPAPSPLKVWWRDSGVDVVVTTIQAGRKLVKLPAPEPVPSWLAPDGERA